MVIAQTPFRMSFFGGGTDYPIYYKEHGGSVLSSTFDKYARVSVSHLPRFFDYSYLLTYSKVERVSSPNDIEHPAIRNAVQYLDMRDIRLSYDADLPARTGIGTSSSFAVGMLNAFYSLKGKAVDKKRLADEAIYLERILCNEKGGHQDQIATSYGGFNRIDFNENGFQVKPIVMSNERKHELNDNLMLFFTGISRTSSEIAEHQEKETASKTAELSEMAKLVDDAEDILVSKASLTDFGRLLDYTWKIKRGITSSISTDFIDDVYERAIKNGARGGKLLGAGGGGFMLLYVEKDKQEHILKCLSDLLYIPFKFEDMGTRVIYYKAEDYFLEELGK